MIPIFLIIKIDDGQLIEVEKHLTDLKGELVDRKVGSRLMDFPKISIVY